MSVSRLPLATVPFPRVKGTKAQAVALDRAVRGLTLAPFPLTPTRLGERRVSDYAQRDVLTVIAAHANGAGFSLLKVATIAHESGWNARTAQRALAALEAEGHIDRYPRMRSPDRYRSSLPRHARQGQGPSIYRVGRVLRAVAGLAEEEWPPASDSSLRPLEHDGVTPGEATSCHPRDANADEPGRVTAGSDPVSPPNERGFPASADFARVTPRTKNGIASDNRGVPTTGSDRTFGLDDCEQIPPWHRLAQLASERNGNSPTVTVDEDGLVWRNEPTAGEAGILADAQALVDAGLAEWEREA